MKMSCNCHQKFILDSSFLCLTVEFGSKIIGFAGAVVNAISIVLSIVMLVVLAVVPALSSDSERANIMHDLVNLTEGNIVYDIINFPDPVTTNIQFVNVVLFVIFGLIVSIITFLSSVILLIGLCKKRTSYVKFSLIVGLMRVALMFITSIAALPSDMGAASFCYMGMPVYLLIVIRSAYYNMLENERLPTETRPAIDSFDVFPGDSSDEAHSEDSSDEMHPEGSCDELVQETR